MRILPRRRGDRNLYITVLSLSLIGSSFISGDEWIIRDNMRSETMPQLCTLCEYYMQLNVLVDLFCSC